MKKTTKSTKITNYRRYPFLNIGTIMFGLLFVYMVICVIMYATSEHTTAYEVTAGALSGNYRYTALALKTEEVVTATQSGAVSYYAREGNKIGTGSTVCSIDESGKLTTAVASETSSSENELDQTSIKDLKTAFSSFSSTFDETTFQDVYSFKADMESSILEMTSEQSLSEIDELQGSMSSLVNLCTASSEGIVVYSIDHYENLQPEEVTSTHFDKKEYSKTNLRQKTTVTSGEPLYKLLTDEKWSMLIAIDKKMATELAEKQSIKFRFLKDGTIFNAAFSVIQNGDEYFGKIDMKNSLIRYSSERYLEIELILNKKSGLKIPKTAIDKKIFYRIPKEYAVYEGDHPVEIGLIRETYNSDGSAVTKYINATVYDESEDSFYIDTGLFKEGDYVLEKDSTGRYQVVETESLEGVYNINKGYAVFREITVIDENEEYCIIKDGSSFGLSQYDYIVLDASTINDEEIVY